MNTLNTIRLVYLIADFLILVFAIRALKKKTKMGNVVAAVMAAGFAVVSFYSASLFAQRYFYMSLFNSCVFFSIDIMLFLLIRYIIHFTKLELKGNSIFSRILFVVIFLMEAIVLMLNPFKELAVTFQGYQMDGFTLYTYVAKPYFMFHLGLCYFMVFIGVMLLLYKIRVTPKMYRARYLNTLISFIGVVLMNFLFLAGMELFSIDFSYIFYVLIAMFIYYATFSFKDRFLLSYRDTVFKNIGLPIIMFDYEQHLGDYNEQAAEVFPFLEEYSGDLMSSLNIREFLTRSGLDMKSYFEDANFIYRTYNEDTEKIFQGRYVCYKENDGKFSAGMFVFHDITNEQKLLENEQRLGRSKTNFLMNVSAGIKKPLHTVLDGMDTLLSMDIGNEKARQVVFNSIEATKMTLKLTQELMDYSMLETGEYALKKECVATEAVIGFLHRIVLKFEKQKQILLEIDDYLPSKLIFDLDKLKRLASSLIYNSVEEADDKPVKILLYYSEESPKRGVLEMEITNSGDNVLEKSMRKIEELLELPEEQIDCTTISEGLELYMTCRLAKKMGGDIRAYKDEDGNNVVHAYVEVELDD